MKRLPSDEQATLDAIEEAQSLEKQLRELAGQIELFASLLAGAAHQEHVDEPG